MDGKVEVPAHHANDVHKVGVAGDDKRGLTVAFGGVAREIGRQVGIRAFLSSLDDSDELLPV